MGNSKAQQNNRTCQWYGGGNSKVKVMEGLTQLQLSRN